MADFGPPIQTPEGRGAVAEALTVEVLPDDPDEGVEVDLDPDAPAESDAAPFEANLVDYIDNSDLGVLSKDLISDFDADQGSRADWEKTYIQGLELLGLKFEDRKEPWDGACGAFHPMLAESCVRFQSQTIQEVFPASGPARAKIVGNMTPEVIEQSDRVIGYMNYLATEEMVEYRTETEKLLFSLPIAGSAFRKVYHDPKLGRPCSMFVPAEDFVVSYGASDLLTASRATHIQKMSPNEVKKLQVKGFYSNFELPEPSHKQTGIEKKYQELTGQKDPVSDDGRHTLLEMMVELDLVGYEQEDGIALPYVVTIDYSSGKILAIYRNWLEDDEDWKPRQYYAHYQYLPGLGFYGFGLTHMIGGLTKSATSILRQLIDAGTLANLPGGLKSRGLRIKGDDTPISPGEFRDVDIMGGAISDNIAFLPYKEPSGVLYQLLGDLVGEGRRFASAADVKVQDFNGEAPVGTTLAILEREMKVLAAIQARVHSAMHKELKMLAGVIYDHGPGEYPYLTEGQELIKEDFDSRVDIIPVSDPNAGSMAQKIMQNQAAFQLSQSAPQIYDQPLLHRNMLKALGMENADELVPNVDEIPPTDPVTENMNVMMGEPVQAHHYQDHEAHLTTHLAAMQNPKLLELMQTDPQAESKQAAMAAHISEHVAYQYRYEIEQELGVEMPAPNEPLPEDIEIRLSRMVAPAADQLTGKDQREAEAKEQMEQAQDPVLQLEKEDLAIKREGQQLDNKKDMANINKEMTIHKDKDNLAKRKQAHDERHDRAQLGAEIARDNAQDQLKSREIASKEQLEGFKHGKEIAKELLGGSNGGKQSK